MRLFHPWWKWECYKAGFFNSGPPDGIDGDEARKLYAAFLGNTRRFRGGMKHVAIAWPHSCEQFLTNENINRVAWLGQSSMCIETGIPSCFRGGFRLLSTKAQNKANATAAEFLFNWLHGTRCLLF